MVTRNRDLSKRMNYFDRQFLRAQDFVDEQDYHLDRLRRHTRALHSPGVAMLDPEGLEVVKKNDTHVTVKRGWAQDTSGRQIVLVAPRDVAAAASGVDDTNVDLYISYSEPGSDASTDPGITGMTRVHEEAVITRVPGDSPSAPDPKTHLPLARVHVDNNGKIDQPIQSLRKPAGISGDNLLDGSVTDSKVAANAAIQEAKITFKAEGHDHTGAAKGNTVPRDGIEPEAINDGKVANDAKVQEKKILFEDAGHDHTGGTKGNKLPTEGIEDGGIIDVKVASGAAIQEAKIAFKADGHDHSGGAKGNPLPQAGVEPGSISFGQLKTRLAVEGSIVVPAGSTRLIPPASLAFGLYLPMIYLISGGEISWVPIYSRAFEIVLPSPPGHPIPVPGPGGPIPLPIPPRVIKGGYLWEINNRGPTDSTVEYRIFELLLA